MKLTFAIPIAALALAPLAHAQSDHMKGMDMGGHEAAKAPQARQHHAAGVVKAVDAAKGTVAVAHGPIATLSWPAMTMTFKASDKAVLQSLEPGAKVEFDFEERGKDYVITAIR